MVSSRIRKTRNRTLTRKRSRIIAQITLKFSHDRSRSPSPGRSGLSGAHCPGIAQSAGRLRGRLRLPHRPTRVRARRLSLPRRQTGTRRTHRRHPEPASGIRRMEPLAGSTHQAGHRRAMPSDPGARRAKHYRGRRRPEPPGAPRGPKSVQPERP